MYTAVLMLAMTTGTDAIDHGRGGCRGGGCSGCYSSYNVGWSGCCSSGGMRMGYYGPGGYYLASGYSFPNGMAYSQINGATNGSVRESFYLAPGQQQTGANVRVIVPNPDAEIWFNNAPTQQRGFERLFASGPIEPGNYAYTIKARWTENGQAVERTRTVQVQPGQPVTVDLRANQGENLQQPNRGETLPTPNNPTNPPDRKSVV